MLDDLRNEAQSSFDEEKETPELENELTELAPRRRRRPSFMGMTSGQRFVIALMLFLMVCLLGAFCLIVFEKIVLPI